MITLTSLVVALNSVQSINEFADSGSKIRMIAQLNGENEIPPKNTNAEGIGNFILDTQNNILYFNIESDLKGGKETAAHIHGFASKNENADHIFILPTTNPKIGEWHYNEEDEDKILAGQTYVNIHTEKYPEGEIRGQILVSQ